MHKIIYLSKERIVVKFTLFIMEETKIFFQIEI